MTDIGAWLNSGQSFYGAITQKNESEAEAPPAPEAEWETHRTRGQKKAERKKARSLIIKDDHEDCACCPKLNILSTVNPVGAVSKLEGEQWEEMVMAVDSGASETVVNGEQAKSIATQPSEGSKAGVKSEVADGSFVHNEGEKKCC